MNLLTKSSGLMLACSLAACGNQGETPSGTFAAVSKANPASVYCNDLGGKLEISTSDAGEMGYCHLPDGTVIEEWQLYRDQNPL